MPEEPEIALTSDILNKYIKGKTMIDIEFISGRYSRKDPQGFKDFLDNLPLKVNKIDTKGKFLWFVLVDPKNSKNIWYIWNTFGLTGMWSFEEKDHTRAIFTFNDKSKVYFSDMRNFGTFKFSDNRQELIKKLNQLGPDFLKDEKFNLSKITKYNIPVVKLLMDQKKLGSGIGNYLSAEILYRAKISPHRLGSDLSNAEIKNLEFWIKSTMKLAYESNFVGYMINLAKESSKVKRKNYHPDIKLKEKKFDFLVYRKKTDPYGNKVKADKIVGTGANKRSTYWVPAVQK
ncbi:glycosylase [Cotonvirus japonicus]|uniref:Glycosylase n=1 Tax=Cotonvirus japonicus TaxID=2811091 RepID=A0ABM7NT45_9VIRU|nr:glycosylase [Cotonvirus japonicus]BCS83271.1 glycosylase [Cotonvirus japonicus]